MNRYLEYDVRYLVIFINHSCLGEVVVAQLVEWLLPIPEVHGLNPLIGKIYIEYLFTCLLSTVLKRRK